MESKRQVCRAKIESILARICGFLRLCIFRVISVGPLPNHIAFIMDGNRRYTMKKKLDEKEGYRIGCETLKSILKYCYELRMKHVSVYAFSIDNFKRKGEIVAFLMELLKENIEGMLEEENIVEKYGLRVNFIGNLNLLNEELRVAAEKAMRATAKNQNVVLQVCVAYTATDEIVHAVEESCRDKWRDGGGPGLIELEEIEKHMYMAVVPEPDILVRTAGGTRLSNFILWHTQSCLLYASSVLWPEFGFWHLVCVLLNFQRYYQYLQRKRKKSWR